MGEQVTRLADHISQPHLDRLQVGGDMRGCLFAKGGEQLVRGRPIRAFQGFHEGFLPR